MTTMTPMTTNGRLRKSLADQIDRLDHILDGLADALNEAVAAAVTKAVGLAVQEAVRGVLSEVLTNPEVLARLRATVVPPPPAVPLPTAQPVSESLKTRLGKRLRRVGSWIGACLQAIGPACGACVRRVGQAAGAVWVRLQIVRTFKMQLLVALLIGAAAGAAAFEAGPWLSAVASGLGGFATAVSIQAGIWVRRLLAGLSCPST